jgi:hypothetical protein
MGFLKYEAKPNPNDANAPLPMSVHVQSVGVGS